MMNGRTVERMIAMAAAPMLMLLVACANQPAQMQQATQSPAAAEDERPQASGPVHQSEEHSFRVVTVVDGLAHPWGMVFLPGGDVLVTEREGRLRLIRNGVLQEGPIAGVPPVYAMGQGGLLDIALHPDYATNRLVYLSYSKPGDRGATTAVSRGRFDGSRLTGVEEIFEAQAWGTRRVHFGSRMVFDRDGFLYLTIGDRGDATDRGREQRAQDLNDHAGTTLRLHDDGRVPADNPFAGRADALPEIYTWGNRNAQGMAIHPQTGQIWQNEHGPRGGDEINIMRPGANYGWPVVSHGINYDRTTFTERTEAPGMEPPLLVWTPSIAPSGFAFYTGEAFPRWRGNAFIGALVEEHLRRVVLDGTRVVSQEVLLADLEHRIRDVRVGPDGFLYLLVDSSDGPLLRLEPVQ
jgi:aldose sugar dehydrogenase